MKDNSYNAQVFLETACFVAFAASMLYLVISGKYLTYVTPRVKPYLYFSAAVMTLWAFFNLGRMRRPQHILRSMHCLVLAVPIILLLVPHRPLDIASISTTYVGGGAIPGTAGGGASYSQSGAEGSPPSIADEVPPVTGLPGLDAAARRIVISDELFYEWIAELYANMDAYEGYTVSMTGFVLKDPEFGENGFVPARLAMTCCVADLVPMGMISVYDDLDSLEDESWVTVEGELFSGLYLGESEPQLRVTSVAPAEPVDGYVYAY